MIWFWIGLAVFISWLLCRGKIRWIHYIWILLPIEMYGLSVAGAIIKPYMIFGAFIFGDNLLKRRRMIFPPTVLFVSILLLMSDCLTGLIKTSIMQHIMFLLIVFIICNYLIAQKREINLNEIGKVAMAATIGYGFVFTVVSLLYLMNINLDGIYTVDRFSVGMLVRFGSAGGVADVRLRGFCIDPNSVITTLVPGAAFAAANLLYLRKETIKSLAAIVFYFIVVYFSGSRMGLFCSLIMIVLMFAMGYKASKKKRKLLITAGFIIALITIAITREILFYQNDFFYELSSRFLQFINSRSSLTSKDGRVTIWRTNIKYLIENNRWFFGVGQNQIYTLTHIHKECHNTWLEWICGTGIWIGMFMNLWILLAPLKLYKKRYGIHFEMFQLAVPLVLAYITVIICITTIDNITNSVLLFLMMIIRYGKWKVDC